MGWYEVTEPPSTVILKRRGCCVFLGFTRLGRGAQVSQNLSGAPPMFCAHWSLPVGSNANMAAPCRFPAAGLVRVAKMQFRHNYPSENSYEIHFRKRVSYHLWNQQGSLLLAIFSFNSKLDKFANAQAERAFYLALMRNPKHISWLVVYKRALMAQMNIKLNI